MVQNVRKVGLLLCLLLVPMTASAQNLRLLQDSIWSDMTAEDAESLKASVRESLQEAPDRKVIEWSSPSSDMKGRIVSKYTYQSRGTDCRRMALQLIEQERRQNQHFDACRSGDTWEVVSQNITFSEVEREEIRGFMSSVLDDQEEGVPVSWSTDDGSPHLVVVPTDSADDKSGGCRNAAIHISTEQGEAVSGQYRFCKTREEQWRYRPE